MTTVLDIITDAMGELGLVDPDSPIEAGQANYGLRVLNRMLSMWSTEDLMVYTVNRQTFDLVAGQQVYTIGTGGNFNIPRPVKIERASALIAGTLPLEIPIKIIDDQEWQGISLKQTGSTFPTKLWITNDVPLNNLWFWPLPKDSTVKVILYVWGLMGAYTTLQDQIILPLGYEEALVTNLAIFLSNAYGTGPLPVLQARAMGSKNAIMSQNLEPMYASCDSALVGRGAVPLAIRVQGLLVD